MKPDFKTWMVWGLRRISYRWPARYKVKKASWKGRNQYLCAKCKNIYGNRQVVVDHIEPIVDPKVGFVDWNTYIARMFVGEDGLQVLCKKCHKKKTDKENVVRRKKS